MPTVTAPAAFAIKGQPNETFTVSFTNENENLPLLKADLIRRGFDGRIYTLERIIEGTRKRPMSILCFRGKNEGAFVSML